MVDVREYLRESNAIENVHSESALLDALEAWEYLQQQDELTVDVVKRTHEVLLQNQQPSIAGEFRDVFVRVGGDRPPAPEQVPSFMGDLLNFTPQTGVEAIQWHVDFEKIHPHRDGNGRTGRLLYLWHCVALLHAEPVMWREEDVQGYYSLFRTES